MAVTKTHPIKSTLKAAIDYSNARCLPFVKYIPAAPPFLRA